jgi:hypothetical protein
MQNSRLNDIIVGDLEGDLYDLNLPGRRNRLILPGGLSDKVVDSSAENNLIKLGSGFGTITDLVSRPDGLYVLSIDGDIYRIATLGIAGPPPASTIAATPVPEPSTVAILARGNLRPPLTGTLAASKNNPLCAGFDLAVEDDHDSPSVLLRISRPNPASI